MSNDGQRFEGSENTDLNALAFGLDALTYSDGRDEIEISFFDVAVVDVPVQRFIFSLLQSTYSGTLTTMEVNDVNFQPFFIHNDGEVDGEVAVACRTNKLSSFIMNENMNLVKDCNTIAV